MPARPEETGGVRTVLLVAAALALLLGAAVGAWQLQLGAPASLSIAAAKAALLLWFYMHLERSSPMQRLFAALGATWLAILFALTLGDVLTRR